MNHAIWVAFAMEQAACAIEHQEQNFDALRAGLWWDLPCTEDMLWSAAKMKAGMRDIQHET